MLNAQAHGHIGRDVEVRYAGQDNQAVADIAIGCNYGRKVDGKTPTQWVKATLWGKQAESLGPYLTKGKGVVATLADVHIETYTDRDGKAGTSLVGRLIHIEFTGAGPREDEHGTADGQQRAPAPAPRAAAPAPRAQAPAPRASTGFDDMDSDDIPF